MPSPTSRHPLAAPAEFVDGLGVRSVIAEKHGETLEQFRIRPEFCSNPDFELALRERVSRLANFRHGYYARVRRIEKDAGALAVVSERPAGARLSHVLDVSERHGLDLDINAALCLLRQLVPAVATLHQNARDVSHGALAPERIVVTAHARIVVTDYVLGSAIEELHLSRERLWRELQVAVPPGAGTPHLNHRADVMQIGLIALALVRGRRLHEDELRSAADLVVSATENVLGQREPLSAPLRRWLMRALQLDPRAPYESAADAQAGLEEVLASEAGYIAAPVALETFLSRYQECALLDAEEADEGEEDGDEDDESVEEERPSAATPAPSVAPGKAPSAPRVAAPQSVGAPPVAPASTKQSAVPALTNAPATPSASVAPVAREPVDEVAPPAAPASAVRRETPKAAPAVQPEPQPVPVPAVSIQASGGSSSMLFGTSGTEWTPVDDASAEPPPTGMTRLQRAVLIAAVAIAVLEAAFIGYMRWLSPSALLAGKQGTLSIESRPTAVPVVIDGEARGNTPVTVQLPSGPHVIELGNGAHTRIIPITIEAGRLHGQYIELPSQAMTGAVQIRGPAGVRVLVDGELRGTTPVTIGDLAPGEHELVFDGPHGQTRQKVTIAPGTTASLTPGGEATLVGTGWAVIETPYEMQIFEDGRLLGTTASGRLPLTAGRHVLEIVSDTLGFRVTRTVTISAGESSRVAVSLPTGRVSITSDPVAEVWLEGQKIGDTPLENFPLPVGPHEIVFKHPTFGEQHHVISVTAGTPARLAVTLTR